MVAATAVEVFPKYFPDSLDLPLDPDHKTWHTERLCPPLLAQALGERQAMFIAQLHYWLQRDNVGVYKHGWHWIYNAEWEWQEQFPWLSEYTMGRIRRALERRGYVVSNDFNRNPLDRTKHSTLDYYLIAQETGWNPLGLDLNRSYPRPPVFTKGVRQRGRHKSDSTPLVYNPFDGDEPERLKQPETVDSANLQNASCKSVTMHSALMPVSSIYKEVLNTSKSNLETDLKIELKEGSQGVGGFQLQVNENDTRSDDGLYEAESLLTEISSQEQFDAAAATSLINDEEIDVAQQFLTSFNTEVERTERYRIPPLDQTRPIRIPGLDDSAHYILWKYQAQLEKLNADLNAERIKSAILDNPQYLESAILAFIENSATGAKTPQAATGFLFNALRQGWKPRQSKSRDGDRVPVYTPHPLMLESHKPPTLDELVERKRLMWKTAILRLSIVAWAEATPGVVLTESGPALEQQVETPTTEPQSIDEKDPEPRHATNAAYPTNLNSANPVVASNQTAPLAAATPTESQKLDPNPPLEVEHLIEIRSEQPHLEVNQADNVASNPTPLPPETTADPARVEPTLEQSPLEPLRAKPKQQRSNRQLQRVEILSSAGEWVGGYLVHQGIAVANLAGSEHRFKLFDASGSAYIFFGQIRPPASGLD